MRDTIQFIHCVSSNPRRGGRFKIFSDPREYCFSHLDEVALNPSRGCQNRAPVLKTSQNVLKSVIQTFTCMSSCFVTCGWQDGGTVGRIG